MFLFFKISPYVPIDAASEHLGSVYRVDQRTVSLIVGESRTNQSRRHPAFFDRERGVLGKGEGRGGDHGGRRVI